MRAAVAEIDEAADGIIALLETEWLKNFHRHGKGKAGWRADSVVKKAYQKGVCNSHKYAWQGLAMLADQGVIVANPTQLRYESSHRIRLAEDVEVRLRGQSVEPAAELPLDAEQRRAWSRAMDQHQGMRNLEPRDQLALAKGLQALAAMLPGAYEQMTAYVASARYLLGSSKLLESLPRELLTAFSIDPRRFRRARMRLLASVPQTPSGLLLIENLQSFDQACRLGVDRQLAVLCSFGYGLSLSESLINAGHVTLIGENTAPRGLLELLTLESITYWGDMDPEGLRIYRRLQRRLPHMRLSALYAPMMAALDAGYDHPLQALTGKGGQAPAGEWLRGLDQEWLADERVIELAGQALPEVLEQRWIGLLAIG